MLDLLLIKFMLKPVFDMMQSYQIAKNLCQID
jgi:hypothetical protein